jgi:hypothetical protein
MNLLVSKNEVLEQLQSDKVQQKNRLTSVKYADSLTFFCGGGSEHRVNDPLNVILGVAMPVKFLMLTPATKYVTFIQCKGLFKISALSLWSCEYDLFREAAKEYKYRGKPLYD